MSLFNRFSNLIKKGTNTLLAPAEDPREKYSDPQVQPRHLLRQVSHALAQTQTFLQHLAERKTTLELRVPDLEREARTALQTNRETLARVILNRRQAILTEIAGINQQIQEAQQEEIRLMLVKQKVETQIEMLQTRQQALAARYSAAEVHVRLHESLAGVAETFSGMGLALEETVHRVDQMQARAAAVNDLWENGVLEAGDFPGTDLLEKSGGLAEAQAVEAFLDQLKTEETP